MYFEYGETETTYLAKRDKRLGEAILKIGHIYRGGDNDLFQSVVYNIIGQQISSPAQRTICNRLIEKLGTIDPPTLAKIPVEELQTIGISYRKASYIMEFADKICCGQFDIEALWQEPDEIVIRRLSECRGIGVWTAEMLLLFTMKRTDVLSYGDLAIQRGMRMLYRHKEITRERFERYRKRYQPYGSVASLYLWAIAGGAIEGLTDPIAVHKRKA